VSGNIPTFPRHLGNIVILAKIAAEITPRCGDGKGTGTGMDVEKGLFLYGIDVFRNDSTVNEGMEDTLPVFTDAAQTPFPLIDDTLMAAETAMYPPVGNFFIKQGFPDHLIIYAPL
jgi:hypothetical protein